MYLNVKALTIGFTKIDIIGFTYNNVDYYLSGMMRISSQTTTNLNTGNSALCIDINNDDYLLRFVVNESGNTVSITQTDGYIQLINSVAYR